VRDQEQGLGGGEESTTYRWVRVTTGLVLDHRVLQSYKKRLSGIGLRGLKRAVYYFLFVFVRTFILLGFFSIFFSFPGLLFIASFFKQHFLTNIEEGDERFHSLLNINRTFDDSWPSLVC
jgi:hypothetical protein